jgi:hypothetical protein
MLRKGQGEVPYTDAVVKGNLQSSHLLVRLAVVVNDKVLLSNFPEGFTAESVQPG